MDTELQVLTRERPPAACCLRSQDGTPMRAEAASGVDFWQQPLTLARLQGMQRKYALLQTVTAYGDEGPCRAQLRAAATAWPACLREAELVAPERIRLRAQAVDRALASLEKSQPLSLWPPGPLLAAVLADHLHTLLRAQLQPRLAGASRVDVAHMMDAAQAEFPWPVPEVWREFAGSRLRTRAAYLWLAAWSGLGMVALQYCLFERRGHWETRPDDPDWTRASTAG